MNDMLRKSGAKYWMRDMQEEFPLWVNCWELTENAMIFKLNRNLIPIFQHDPNNWLLFIGIIRHAIYTPNASLATNSLKKYLIQIENT